MAVIKSNKAPSIVDVWGLPIISYRVSCETYTASVQTACSLPAFCPVVLIAG